MAKRRRTSPARTQPRLEPRRAETQTSPSARRRLFVGLGLLALAVCAAAAFFAARGRRPTANVLLVTIDTLRADHVGCYGDQEAATPVLDGLASRGTRFATAIAHVPLTTPSHASILTGLTPPRHGIHDNGGFALPAGLPTLASVLREAGYRTAAFVSGFPLDRRFGLDRGFDVYDDRLPYGDDPRRAAYVERKADATTDAALRWVQGLGQTSRPWFAWVHYFDPHAPYEPPAEYRARFADRPYDGEVAFVDAQLGRLLRWLDEAHLSDRTIVLVTSDHGESLGEHGEDTHGVFVYDATLRVPWLMAGPGVGKGRVAETVARGIDVTPTLLDLAGRSVPSSMEGRSLRRAARAPLADAPAYVESRFTELQLGWAPLTGLRAARWKLIEAPQPELYDLDADPRETANRYEHEPAVASQLLTSLRAALTVRAPDAARPADADAEQRLRALGYIAASGSSPGDGKRRDPKQAIGLLRNIERGLAEARANPELAVSLLSSALQQDPHMALARRYRAIAEAERKDYPAAIADLQALESNSTSTGDDLVLLGECLSRTGRAADALGILDRAAGRLPGSPEPLLARARALRSLGREDEAAQAYQQILARVSDQPEAMRGLADLALARGDLAGAATLYARIRESDPKDVGALVKLGVVAMRTGRVPDAVAAFQEAVALRPSNAEALLDLGGALARSGRAAEAVPFLERALDLGPRTPVALNSLGFARLESGDEQGALAALRASLALDGRQPQVRAAVAELTSGAQ